MHSTHKTLLYFCLCAVYAICWLIDVILYSDIYNTYTHDELKTHTRAHQGYIWLYYSDVYANDWT